LSQWTFEEASAVFAKHGGNMVACYTYEEFLADPQVQHLGVVIEVPDGAGTRLDLRPPWQMSATPASVRRPAPRLDEHATEIREQIVTPRKWSAT
jgi:crotonobetainyl-CoA:carnitine CoA-transferase CaiB-like acyl-CoA transferase